MYLICRGYPVIRSQEQLSEYMQKNPDASVISRKQYEDEITDAADFVPVFEQRDTFEKPVTVIYELR